MMPLRVHPEARVELREAAAHYEAQRTGLGREFVLEVRAAYERIRQLPEASQSVSTHCRRRLVNRFPYGIIYQLLDGHEIVVVAIMHLHREPGYWAHREVG
jgi:plasmid stabilization system protein ParE